MRALYSNLSEYTNLTIHIWLNLSTQSLKAKLFKLLILGFQGSNEPAQTVQVLNLLEVFSFTISK